MNVQFLATAELLLSKTGTVYVRTVQKAPFSETDRETLQRLNPL